MIVYIFVSLLILNESRLIAANEKHLDDFDDGKINELIRIKKQVTAGQKSSCLFRSACDEGGLLNAPIPCYEEREPHYLNDTE